MEEKKNIIQYAILSLFTTLFQIKKKKKHISKYLQKTVPSLKFNINANTY